MAKAKTKNKKAKGSGSDPAPASRARIFEPYFDSTGVPPRTKWTQALQDLGLDPGDYNENGEHSAVCPAHNDRTPSLSWRETAMGEILFHCHTGCEGDDIVKALGLKWWQLKHVSYEFDYYDPQGTYRFTVKRTQKTTGDKQFTQYRKGVDASADDGEQAGNGLEPGEGFFWLEPALEEWAQDLRASGKKGTLWLCHTADTEILTDRGWVGFPQLLDTDKVAQVDRVTGRMSYAVPDAVQRIPYAGPTVQFASGARVTPDHRMWSRSHKAGPNRTDRAKDLNPRYLIPSATISDHGAESSSVSADDARLIAAWQADGVWEDRGNKVHFTLVKDRKVRRLRALLDRLGIEYETREYNCPSSVASGRKPQQWTVVSKDAHPAFRPDKSIPAEAVDWSLEARQALLDEVTHWDGDRASETSGRFFTRDLDSIDAVQSVAVTTGVRADLTTYDRRDRRPNSSVEYRLHLNWEHAWRKSSGRDGGWYDGVVYCATVPDDTLITRRNGRLTVSHNCEGEKDAVSIWTANGAGTSELEFCTTTPGGAEGWNLGHTERIESLIAMGVLSAVQVVCDPDPAGARRGAQLRETLEMVDGGEDLAVSVVTIEAGKDLAELTDEYGKKWDRNLVEIDEAENRTMLEEGTAACGWMLRLPLGLGASVGRVGLGIRVKEEPLLVLAADIWPTQRFEDGSGWTVDVQPPRGETKSLILNRSDLSSKSGFDRWLIEKARVSLTPRSGIGGGEVAASLAAWLDWLCEVRDVGTCVITHATDWVHPRTGEAMRKIGFDGLEPVWVDGSTNETVGREQEGLPWTAPGASLGPEASEEDQVGLRYIGPLRAAPWGQDLSSREAAQAWTQALLFGDRETVAGIAGWAGAMMLMPWLGSWAETKPGLAIIANSGAGKTSGVARLLLGLCGAQTNSTMSPAALRRSLSQGGVSSIWWLDDSSHVNDDSVKEIMRVATSQGDHVLGNADAGAGATTVTSLHGCLVISAEGVSWLGETAMQDRFCYVHPVNPQGRLALWGPEAANRELQWAHVQDWMRQFDNGNRVAGWTVRGIWEQRGKIDQWVREIGKPKGRSQVAEWLSAIGVRALVSWLEAEREAAGDSWLKQGAGAVEGGPEAFAYKRGDQNPLESWEWLREASEQRLDLDRHKGKSMNSLVTEVLASVFTRTAGSVTGGKIGAAAGLVLAVPEIRSSGKAAADLTHDRARDAIRERLTGSDGMEWSFPIVLTDADNRVWVSSARAADWYGQNIRGADVRTTSKDALRRQLEEITDNPEWAVTERNKGGGRMSRLHGIEIRKKVAAGSGQMSKVQYVRLSEEASAFLLEGDG